MFKTWYASWMRGYARCPSANARNMYSLSVLRKAIQEYKNETEVLATHIDLDPFFSLIELKYSEEFFTTTHSICFDVLIHFSACIGAESSCCCLIITAVVKILLYALTVLDQ